MKIAVSASGEYKESELDRRFGRCDYFQIYDTETSEYSVIGNEGVASGGGAGIAAASQIIDKNVNVIITGNLGPNAFELLEKADMKAYSCDAVPVFRAIEMYQKNQLSEISIAGSAHHGM
ncbi:NifB/NifX family molybdenum-iron cluster-binding protein [Clostridium boliviensis]|uniref:NifB/NifX family molybdenum-iron cluster-binding protein n=1 Tax=Clostridium boliviensis TaxID=318465 RepID=A0ABU4GK89_9CLOT|nr:NifB/NifX family molybdenum-iron cluster-binding protein [Clostridium boliviensis]MDW2798032.1 NifB/NifX family molybdenum-iron cluster-binding protein [Clostridium boliviensis]